MRAGEREETRALREGAGGEALAGVALGRGRDRAGSALRSLGIAPTLLALLLSAAVFAGHWSLGRELDALEAFGQYDVLFDTDPHIRLEGFSHGWGKFNRNLLHPNLANLVNPPVRFVARALLAAGVAEGDVMALRRSLGLMVTPLVSALQTLATFVFFSLAGLPAAGALLLTLLGAVGFSQWIFGTVPDHWAIGGLTLTFAWILAADMVRRRGQVRWWGWVAAAWLAASITVSNLAVVGLIFVVSLALSRRRADAPVRRGARLMLTAALLTYLSYAVLNLGYDTDPQPGGKTLHWTGFFLGTDVPGKLAEFPAAAVGAVAPPAPRVAAIRYKQPRYAAHDIQFTFTGTPGLLSDRNGLGLFVFLLAAAGAVCGLRARGALRPLIAAALAVLAFNALFHAVWGHEYFLYSQHWLTALLLLPAGLFAGPPEVRRTAVGLLAVTVLLVALNSAFHLRDILAALAAT